MSDILETQSPTIGKIAEALAKAHLEMQPARKDNVNPHFKSRYAGLPEVNEASVPVLAKYGIAVTQPTVPIGDRCYVVTTFLHISGEWIRGYFPIIADRQGPQAVGSGTTYARRFGLSGMAAQSSTDDDAEHAQGKPESNWVEASKTAKSPLPPQASSVHLSERQLNYASELFKKAGWDTHRINTYLSTLGLKDLRSMNSMQFDHLIGILMPKKKAAVNANPN